MSELMRLGLSAQVVAWSDRQHVDEVFITAITVAELFDEMATEDFERRSLAFDDVRPARIPSRASSIRGCADLLSRGRFGIGQAFERLQHEHRRKSDGC